MYVILLLYNLRWSKPVGRDNIFFEVEMKKFVSFLLLLALSIFCLTSCVVSDSESVSEEEVVVRVGSLKGPTTIGIVNLMNDDKDGKYAFTMETQADAIAAKIVSGDLDVALIPANLASNLYNKTKKITVIDINTLGVLYCVTGTAGIDSVSDLAGKTVYSTGQGTTPQYSIEYLLAQNNVTDCTIEYKSEATEIAALLKNDSSLIAVLPQPFVTVAMAQNSELSVAFSLSDEWDAVTDESRLITGVTVVRNDFLEKYPNLVKAFLTDHAKSVSKCSEDLDLTAQLVVAQGIIANEAVAKKAIPACNVACVVGNEMKTAVSGYLSVLYSQNEKSVGGALPGEDFYYIG